MKCDTGHIQYAKKKFMQLECNINMNNDEGAGASEKGTEMYRESYFLKGTIVGSIYRNCYHNLPRKIVEDNDH